MRYKLKNDIKIEVPTILETEKKITSLVDSVCCAGGDSFEDSEEKASLHDEKSEEKETLVGSITNPLYLCMVSG